MTAFVLAWSWVRSLVLEYTNKHRLRKKSRLREDIQNQKVVSSDPGYIFITFVRCKLHYLIDRTENKQNKAAIGQIKKLRLYLWSNGQCLLQRSESGKLLCVNQQIIWEMSVIRTKERRKRTGYAQIIKRLKWIICSNHTERNSCQPTYYLPTYFLHTTYLLLNYLPTTYLLRTYYQPSTYLDSVKSAKLSGQTWLILHFIFLTSVKNLAQFKWRDQ